jgi:hypothetical protein
MAKGIPHSLFFHTFIHLGSWRTITGKQAPLTNFEPVLTKPASPRINLRTIPPSSNPSRSPTHSNLRRSQPMEFRINLRSKRLHPARRPQKSPHIHRNERRRMVLPHLGRHRGLRRKDYPGDDESHGRCAGERFWSRRRCA